MDAQVTSICYSGEKTWGRGEGGEKLLAVQVPWGRRPQQPRCGGQGLGGDGSRSCPTRLVKRPQKRGANAFPASGKPLCAIKPAPPPRETESPCFEQKRGFAFLPVSVARQAQPALPGRYFCALYFVTERYSGLAVI